MPNVIDPQGAVKYLADDDGNIVSEGYHQIPSATRGRRGRKRHCIHRIPDPTRNSWEKVDMVGAGDLVGYDGAYWYLLDADETPNSEPYTYIWVTKKGRLRGYRNGHSKRITRISQTEPDCLPDGTPLSHSVGAKSSLTDGCATGQQLFIYNGTIRTRTGSRVTTVRTASQFVTPPCAPASRRYVSNVTAALRTAISHQISALSNAFSRLT